MEEEVKVNRLRGVILVLLIKPALVLLVSLLALLLGCCWSVWRVVLVLYDLKDRFSDQSKR